MRKDMFEVIVERPRRKPWSGPGEARARLARAFADDSAPLSGRRAAALAGDRKHLNENLAPLRRFLARQVGRPWRKVFAEICATLDSGSTVKRHVRDHLEDLIVVRVGVGRNGEWIGPGTRGGQGVAGWYERLYVDPEDGIIKETAKLRRKLGLDPRPASRRRPAPEPDLDRVVVSADEELRRFDGIWYRVRLGASVAKDFDGPHLWCGVPRNTPPPRARASMPGHGVWRELLSKRQLGARALAKFGLANAPR
jgi:hypothetical protein